MVNATDLELPSADELDQEAAADIETTEEGEQAAAAVEAGDELPAQEAAEVPAQEPMPEVPAPQPIPEPPSKAPEWLAAIKRARREVAITKAAWLEAKDVASSAKKEYEAAQNKMNRVIDGERPLPVIDAIEAVEVADPPAVVEAAVPDDAWRSVSIDQLGLPAKLCDKLRENDIATIGQLEDLRGRAGIAGAGLRSIKGIGKAKVDAIEDAVISWLSRGPHAAALQGAK